MRLPSERMMRQPKNQNPAPSKIPATARIQTGVSDSESTSPDFQVLYERPRAYRVGDVVATVGD